MYICINLNGLQALCFFTQCIGVAAFVGFVRPSTAYTVDQYTGLVGVAFMPSSF